MKLVTKLLALTALALVACGGAPAASTATPTTAATATTAATSSAAPTASAATTAAAGAWTVSPDSKATVSVREQLVGVNFPSDAVLVAKGATGSFTINSDSSFSADSKITFDLTTLTSDQRQRDDFVKQSVLRTRQFPTATFVPEKTNVALSLPLVSNTELKFKLSGKITIRGITKDVTFDVVAKRSGGQLAATATADPTWTFEDFGMEPPAIPGRVLSVVDEIRLVIDLVANGASV